MLALLTALALCPLPAAQAQEPPWVVLDVEADWTVFFPTGEPCELSSMAVLLAIGLPLVVWPDEPVPVVTATEPPHPESDGASIETDEARRSDPALLAATMRAQRIVAVLCSPLQGLRV